MKKSTVVLVVLMLLQIFMCLPVMAAPTTIDEIVAMATDAGIEDFPPEWGTMTDFIEQYSAVKEDGTLENDPTSPENKLEKIPEKLVVYNTLMNTFGSKSKYERWRAKFVQFAKVEEGVLKPLEENQGDDYMNKYNGVLGEYNSSVGSTAVNNTADKLFGTDAFDPDNNFLSPVMDVVYYVINTVFSVLSQLFMWGMLAQFGCDLLYIGVDISRKFFIPFQDRNGGGGGIGGGRGVGSTGGFKLAVVSADAASVVQNGATSGGGLSGDTMQSRGKVLSYIIKRAPVLIVGAVFLIMIAANWWSKLISIIASLAINLLTYVINFFGWSV